MPKTAYLPAWYFRFSKPFLFTLIGTLSWMNLMSDIAEAQFNQTMIDQMSLEECAYHLGEENLDRNDLSGSNGDPDASCTPSSIISSPDPQTTTGRPSCKRNTFPG